MSAKLKYGFFMLTKTSLKELLKTNVVSINFKKVDGTDRTILCTLKEDELPKAENKEPKKAVNESVLPVWDLEKKSFRSFRVDSVVDYKVIS